MAEKLTLRNVRIIYRNFSGAERDFNPAGRRNFSVVIEDPDLVDRLASDGWNVKPLKKRNENDPPSWHLPVEVGFKRFPPKVVMISGSVSTLLGEDKINLLDWADIMNVDLTLNPRIYHVGARNQIKAYLRTMYVKVEEDELDADYAYLSMNEDGEVPF